MNTYANDEDYGGIDVQDHLASQLANWLSSEYTLTIAYSTGADSTALLHALSVLRQTFGFKLNAVHINHQLQVEADQWQTLAEQFCHTHSIPLHCRRITVDNNGQGLEAAAREQRYNAIVSSVHPGQPLLTGHHRDDQAETLLLNLLRGSGLRGLAGIPFIRQLQHAWLIRPLLAVKHADLLQYCSQHKLIYSEDPSNSDRHFDRNWLRSEVLPLLQQRFPAASEGLARSADLLAASLHFERDSINALLDSKLSRPGALPVAALTDCSDYVQYELLYAFITQQHSHRPQRRQLLEFIRQLSDAANDRQPTLKVGEHSVVADRGTVFFVKAPVAFPQKNNWHPTEQWHWPETGCLSITADTQLPDHHLPVFTISKRQGGETIQLADGRYYPVKKLLQSHGIPNWQRQQLPFVWHKQTLHAVGDLFLSKSLLRWLKRYNLHWHWSTK